MAIALTAGVRQNLLSLQSTADMMSSTQNRLATGKKVNSALDNPSNFFTSASLGDRASDLSSLLDSIGQATKTLDAANNGITSLTKLVQSAKSTAQQARQAAGAVNTYAAVNSSSDITGSPNLNGAESIATTTGSVALTPAAINLDFGPTAEALATYTGVVGTDIMANANVAGTDDLGFNVNVGGTSTTVTVLAAAITGNDDATVVSAINTAMDLQLGSAGLVVATTDGLNAGTLSLAATSVDVDIEVVASVTTNEIGLTTTDSANRTINGTTLLDSIIAGGGSAGSSLTFDVNGGSANGGATKTVTFGTGAGQINTLAELATELTSSPIGGGATIFADATNFDLDMASGAGNSIKMTVSDEGVRDALGMGAARANGQGGGMGSTATDLTRTFSSQNKLGDINVATVGNGGNLAISVNGSLQTVGLSGGDSLDDIVTKLSANSVLGAALTFENDNNSLKITAKTSDSDFQVASGAVATALGLTSVAQNSTNMLDRMNAKMGGTAGQGSTLTVVANGGTEQTITFGTGTDQVSTLAEFSTKLSSLHTVSASLSGTSANISVASGTSATSLVVGGTAASVLGLATSQTGAITTTTASTTRSSLQNDFNNVLTQIDSLAKDASYNGNNLLNGDDLKVTFNENGSSSLTIKGVKFDSNNLGMNAQAGTAFQDNAAIDTVIANADKALNTLRTQASKFGSTLTTVQTRQEFTKNMINTLQTGADALVLADTNEEGANLLALQTRQQLSTTALSMANQASQAVLRLF